MNIKFLPLQYLGIECFLPPPTSVIIEIIWLCGDQCFVEIVEQISLGIIWEVRQLAPNSIRITRDDKIGKYVLHR